MLFNNTFSSAVFQSVLASVTQRTAPALALAVGLGLSGCGVDDETVNPVTPSGPAPIATVASEDLAPQSDGCLYGTATYSLEREDTSRGLIVAAQTSCPSGYFIEGSCNPLVTYPDSAYSRYAAPLLAGVCFNSRLTTDRGMDPCQVGALVCAVNAEGDTTETTTYNGGDGEQSTSTETVYGPDLIDLSLLFRCCPNPSPAP